MVQEVKPREEENDEKIVNEIHTTSWSNPRWSSSSLQSQSQPFLPYVNDDDDDDYERSEDICYLDRVPAPFPLLDVPRSCLEPFPEHPRARTGFDFDVVSPPNLSLPSHVVDGKVPQAKPSTAVVNTFTTTKENDLAFLPTAAVTAPNAASNAALPASRVVVGSRLVCRELSKLRRIEDSQRMSLQETAYLVYDRGECYQDLAPVLVEKEELLIERLPSVTDRMQTLRFDSTFESGNLRNATRIFNRSYQNDGGVATTSTSSVKIAAVDQEYDCLCQKDTHTGGNIQWYYFSVRTPPGFQGKRVRFNICNMMKTDSLYNAGMLPVVFSQNSYNNHQVNASTRSATLSAKEAKEAAATAATAAAVDKCDTQEKEEDIEEDISKMIPCEGWSRSGENVCYFQNQKTYTKSRRPTPRTHSKEKATSSSFVTGKKRQRYYYTFSFVYQFTSEKPDVVYFAHCYPYPYTFLQTYLCKIERSPKRHIYFRRKVLCETIGKNRCEILTITAPIRCSDEWKQRPAIILTARTHPGETNGSYVMHGILEFLTGPSIEAERLRNSFVFKIVPMLNPDGVVNGNYRTSLAGVDLNRRWAQPNSASHPTIFHVKQMILELQKKREIVLFCDIHGHSKKMNMFLYGCRPFEQQSQEASLHVRVFPYTLAKMSSSRTDDSHSGGYFSMKDCTFHIHKSKQSTGRVVLWKEFQVLHSFTLEASFCGNGRNKKRLPLEKKQEQEEDSDELFYHYTTRDLITAGQHFCLSLTEMAKMLKPRFISHSIATTNSMAAVAGRRDATFGASSTRKNHLVVLDSNGRFREDSKLADLPSFPDTTVPTAADSLKESFDEAINPFQPPQEYLNEIQQALAAIHGNIHLIEDDSEALISSGSDSEPSDDNLNPNELHTTKKWRLFLSNKKARKKKKMKAKKSSSAVNVLVEKPLAVETVRLERKSVPVSTSEQPRSSKTLSTAPSDGGIQKGQEDKTHTFFQQKDQASLFPRLKISTPYSRMQKMKEIQAQKLAFRRQNEKSLSARAQNLVLTIQDFTNQAEMAQQAVRKKMLRTAERRILKKMDAGEERTWPVDEAPGLVPSESKLFGLQNPSLVNQYRTGFNSTNLRVQSQSQSQSQVAQRASYRSPLVKSHIERNRSLQNDSIGSRDNTPVQEVSIVNRLQERRDSF